MSDFEASFSLPGSAELSTTEPKSRRETEASKDTEMTEFVDAEETRSGTNIINSSEETKGDAEESEGRVVFANCPEKHFERDYDGNQIRTSRYTWYTFFPINLFEQFQRIANAYFLILLILQLIPQISSLSPVSTVVPLVLVLSATAIKDGYDDIIRHRSDREINCRKARVLRKDGLITVQWSDVVVGDVLEVNNNDFIAADLLLLASSEENDLCYIETAELDGETNLKVRQALEETAAEQGNFENFEGVICCEPPNNKLDRFDGRLEWKGKTYSLNNENMLLRGCRLRNTRKIHGLVIFAGHDTKLMQNSGKAPFKRTGIDRLMNLLVAMIFVILFVLCLICAVASSLWEASQGNDFQAYLPWQFNSSHAIATLQFFSYLIVMNTLVPISLYVSVEIIRLGLSWLIDWDVKMYHRESDTPAKARTTTLNEELGQIQYIFSDKTGTLTQNVMTFHMCSIGGKIYGEAPKETEPKPVDFSFNENSDSDFVFYDEKLFTKFLDADPDVVNFFQLISLCHTVMPEVSEVNGERKIIYQAQSPDEGALVSAAKNFGMTFLKREQSDIILEVHSRKGKSEERFELLAILDFDNVRKRMSVIARGPFPSKRIQILCKGADSAVFERLAPKEKENTATVLEHLHVFATEGLRTLCLASRDVSEEEWEIWKAKHHEASTSTVNRDEKLSIVYEEMEKNFKLLGVTAVEDKLQDGVPEAIARLAHAAIKIWVLTGDKEETAINIGYSCRLLTPQMKDPLIMRGRDKKTVKASLEEFHKTITDDLRRAKGLAQGEDVADCPVDSSGFEREGVDVTDGIGDDEPSFALVVNGFSLTYALEDDLKDLFFKTASLCKAVICCRVTPLQKAEVVKLVKKKANAITLAIGDGANDVSMIKAAHIGVGISGKEGRQAVLSSDYSLAQFRYLERLLLIHGRWSYMRMAKFLTYFFYKNFAFTVSQFWYAWFCAFSAQTVYDDWFITLYNVIFTSLPVLALGIFEQDIPEEKCLRYPKLYVPGQQNRLFNKKIFLMSLLYGALASAGLFFIGYGFFGDSIDSNGRDSNGVDVFGDALAGTLVFVVNFQIGLETFYWTWLSHFFTWGSIAAWFAFMFVLYGPGLSYVFPAVFPSGATAPYVCSLTQFWLFLFVALALCLAVTVTVKYLFNVFSPTLIELVRKDHGLECYTCAKSIVQAEAPVAPATPRVERQSTIRGTGYAFSQEPGFGSMIMDGRLSVMASRDDKDRDSEEDVDSIGPIDT